jgi:hypothetical protein
MRVSGAHKESERRPASTCSSCVSYHMRIRQKQAVADATNTDMHRFATAYRIHSTRDAMGPSWHTYSGAGADVTSVYFSSGVH